MSTKHTEPAGGKDSTTGKPFAVFKLGSISIPNCQHTNFISEREDQGKIIYGPPDSRFVNIGGVILHMTAP
jgi:hypothetical protein